MNCLKFVCACLLAGAYERRVAALGAHKLLLLAVCDYHIYQDWHKIISLKYTDCFCIYKLEQIKITGFI